MFGRRKRFTEEELRFAYDVGSAHQLLLERLGKDDELTSFERLLAGLRGEL